MNFDPDLAKVLTRLAEGQFSAEEWLEWWSQNGDRIATKLTRTQWLRLKVYKSGAPCRSAFTSHAEACKILSNWGVAFTTSDRYKLEWETHFAQFCREQEAKRKERRKYFAATLKAIAADFPKFAAYLKRQKEALDCIEAGVQIEELIEWETTHKLELPAAYKKFLAVVRNSS